MRISVGGRADELDGGGPCQHAMPGSPDLTHPTLSEFLLETVAAQLTRALDLGAQVVDDAGTDVRHAHYHEVGEHEPEAELNGGQPQRGDPRCDHETDDDGHRADRCEAGQDRAARRRGYDYCEQQDPYGYPR